MSSSSPVFYPNVTTLPGVRDPQSGPVSKGGSKGPEFDQIFKKEIDLNRVQQPLKFSNHAAQRMSERKISMDPATLSKVREAVDKADSKGIGDTLVLTDDAALIVNIKNRTVVTAMDRGSLNGNVFTNIDGAVII